MDYACPIWRSAAFSHVRKLQVLQSTCLRVATCATWYISNRQIYEDLGVPFFADHIRALTESFDTKLVDAGNPLVRQLGSYLCWPRVNPSLLKRKPRVSRRLIRLPSRLNESRRAGTFWLPWLIFSSSPCFFLSFKANARVLFQDGFFLRHGGFTKMPATVVCLRLCHSGFEPQKAFQSKYAPTDLN